MNLFLLNFDDLSEIKEIRFLQKDNNKKKTETKNLLKTMVNPCFLILETWLNTILGGILEPFWTKSDLEVEVLCW